MLGPAKEALRQAPRGITAEEQKKQKRREETLFLLKTVCSCLL